MFRKLRLRQKNGFLIRKKNLYLAMVQTFCVEPNPGEIINTHYLLMTPDRENTNSDLSLSVLNDRINTSNIKKSSIQRV